MRNNYHRRGNLPSEPRRFYQHLSRNIRPPVTQLAKLTRRNRPTVIPLLSVLITLLSGEKSGFLLNRPNCACRAVELNGILIAALTPVVCSQKLGRKHNENVTKKQFIPNCSFHSGRCQKIGWRVVQVRKPKL